MELTILQLNTAIDKGVAYLSEHQYPNGEFCCYFAPDDEMMEWCVPDSAVFPTTVIATALLELRRKKEVQIMLDKTAGFLQYHMMRGSTWSHCTKWHKLFNMVPPDSDSTVYASYLFKQLKIDHPDSMRVLRCNKSRNGLFYTWLVLRPNFKFNLTYLALVFREIKKPISSLTYWLKFPARRNDIDGIINANILFRYGVNDDTRPIVDYLINVVLTKRETSCDKWYRNPSVIHYFLSRAYTIAKNELERIKEPVIARILERISENSSPRLSAFETALSITSLLNFGTEAPKVESLCLSLISQQDGTGNWKRWIFYSDGAKRMVGFGSEELTTAFCLEALRKYQLCRFTDV